MSAYDENKDLSSVSYEALPDTYSMMADAVVRLTGPPFAFKRVRPLRIHANTATGIPCTANSQISELSRLFQQSANQAAATEEDDGMPAPDPAHGPTHDSGVNAADPLEPSTYVVRYFAAKNKQNPKAVKIPGGRPPPRYVDRDIEPIDYFDRADKATMEMLKQKVQLNFKRNKIIEDGHNAMELEIRQLERIEGHHDYTDWVIDRHRKEQKNLKAGYPAEHGLEPKSNFMLPRYYRQLIKHCPWVAVAYRDERMARNQTRRVIPDPRLVRSQCNAKRRKILAEDAIKRGEKPLPVYEDLVWPCEVRMCEDDSSDEEDATESEESAEEPTEEEDTQPVEAANVPEQPQRNNPVIDEEAIYEEVCALIDGLGIFPPTPPDPGSGDDESQSENESDNSIEAEEPALEKATAGEKEAVYIIEQLFRRVDNPGIRLDRTGQDVRALFLDIGQATRVESAAAAARRARQATAASVPEQETSDSLRLNRAAMARNLLDMMDSDENILDPMVGSLRVQDFVYENQPETHCSIIDWLSRLPISVDRLLDPEQAKPQPESEDGEEVCEEGE